jgi:hypothetical protein
MYVRNRSKRLIKATGAAAIDFKRVSVGAPLVATGGGPPKMFSAAVAAAEINKSKAAVPSVRWLRTVCH